MPELPEVPNGWPAYITYLYWIYEETSNPPVRIVKPLWVRVLEFTLGALAFAVLTLSCVLFFVFLGRAVWQGVAGVLLLLTLFHLPWFAFKILAKQRQAKQAKATRNRIETITLHDSSLNQGSKIAPPISLSLIRVLDSGFQGATFQAWETFERFEYQGEVDRFYRVRLWQKPEKRGTVPSFQNRMTRLGHFLLVFSPPILTVYGVFLAFERFGWREDVRAIAALATFYIAFFLTAWYVAPQRDGEIARSVDLLFDRQTVSATELLNFLEKRVFPE
jgi:Ca2+/Na+ antiporter